MSFKNISLSSIRHFPGKPKTGKNFFPKLTKNLDSTSSMFLFFYFQFSEQCWVRILSLKRPKLRPTKHTFHNVVNKFQKQFNSKKVVLDNSYLQFLAVNCIHSKKINKSKNFSSIRKLELKLRWIQHQAGNIKVKSRYIPFVVKKSKLDYISIDSTLSRKMYAKVLHNSLSNPFVVDEVLKVQNKLWYIPFCGNNVEQENICDSWSNPFVVDEVQHKKNLDSSFVWGLKFKIYLTPPHPQLAK